MIEPKLTYYLITPGTGGVYISSSKFYRRAMEANWPTVYNYDWTGDLAQDLSILERQYLV